MSTLENPDVGIEEEMEKNNEKIISESMELPESEQVEYENVTDESAEISQSQRTDHEETIGESPELTQSQQEEQTLGDDNESSRLIEEKITDETVAESLKLPPDQEHPGEEEISDVNTEPSHVIAPESHLESHPEISSDQEQKNEEEEERVHEKEDEEAPQAEYVEHKEIQESIPEEKEPEEPMTEEKEEKSEEAPEAHQDEEERTDTEQEIPGEMEDTLFVNKKILRGLAKRIFKTLTYVPETEPFSATNALITALMKVLNDLLEDDDGVHLSIFSAESATHFSLTLTIDGRLSPHRPQPAARLCCSFRSDYLMNASVEEPPASTDKATAAAEAEGPQEDFEEEEDIVTAKRSPTPPTDIETEQRHKEEAIIIEQNLETQELSAPDKEEENEEVVKKEPDLNEAGTYSIDHHPETLRQEAVEDSSTVVQEEEVMDSFLIGDQTAEPMVMLQNVADSAPHHGDKVDVRSEMIVKNHETEREDTEMELRSETIATEAENIRAIEAGDFQSTAGEITDVQPKTPEPSVEESKEDTENAAPTKPASRLVRPPNRVIHTAPQGQTANRTQSVTRPSTAMPRPPANATKYIKPPAPKITARAMAKSDAAVKKPAARTQSQQPRPTPEAKTVSQPNTPKVYRKVVTVSSKIGSFTDHKPQGGNVQIFSENRTYNAQSKIGSLHNVTHTPGGGNVKIPNMKLDFKEKAKPKIEAKSDYVPPVPEKKMITQKLNWNAHSKIGSLDNVKHKPAGGNVQILNQKLEWHATSKVGSKDNIKHKPGGGNVQIFDERIQYVSTNRRSNSGSLGNVSNQSRNSRNAIDVLDL
ncbi:hypothetical protein RB195_009242 [Necator americanus]|uniref:Microtubule-associated protein n=2 Tax=Necator americanus TaxID=51031 RepID=A0ABR1CTW0_NECAM